MDQLAALTGGLDLGALTGGGLDLGSLLGGLTGTGSTSNCAPNDLECKAAEDAAAAKAALEKKNKADNAFLEERENTPSSSTGLECSMDGFVDMALKLVENLLLIVSLIKELFAYAFPAELSESLELLWKGAIGSSSWMGYAGYALYGVGLDYNFAAEVCEAFGYGFYVIDGMNYIVAFAQPSGEGEGGEGGATDPLALLAAGADALSQATGVDLSGVTDLIPGAASDASAEAGAEADEAAAAGEEAAPEGEASAEASADSEGVEAEAAAE